MLKEYLGWNWDLLVTDLEESNSQPTDYLLFSSTEMVYHFSDFKSLLDYLVENLPELQKYVA